MTFKRIITTLVILVVLVGGGYWAYSQFLAPVPEEENPVEAVNTTSVNTEVDVVSAEAQIVPLRHARLSFDTGGRVVEILAAEGDTVQAGDPLVRLDATNQEIAVTQAEAGLLQAQANLQTAESQLAAAQANLQTAETGVLVAQTQLALITAEPSPEQIALSQSGVAIANANITLADANRDLALEPASDAQIYAAQAQINAAQAAQLPLITTQNQFTLYDIEGEAVDQLQLQLNAAQAQVDAAIAALNDLQEGATPAQQQAANGAVAVAAANRDVAQAQLDLLLAGVKPEQVAVAEIGVQQAETAVSQAELAVAQAETAVSQAQAGVDRAQIALQAAQTALENMTLTAPFAGTITALAAEVGEVVGPGLLVATLADMNGWQAETTDLTELDVVNVELGQSVAVRVDALPDDTINGIVTNIATVAAESRGDIVYVVTIDLDETELPLRWGMTAFVDVDVK